MSTHDHAGSGCCSAGGKPSLAETTARDPACGMTVDPSTLTLAEKAGQSLELTAVQPALDLSQTSVAAVLIAAGYAVYCQAGPRSIILFSLLGALGHLVYTVSDRSGVSGMSSTAAAATVLGILTVLLARPMNWPASGALDIAVIPLVPGMAFYQALAGFVNHDASAAAHLFEGLATSIAIGAGAVLGQFVSSRVLWQARRAQVNHLAKRDGTSIAEAEFEATRLALPQVELAIARQESEFNAAAASTSSTCAARNAGMGSGAIPPGCTAMPTSNGCAASGNRTRVLTNRVGRLSNRR